MSTSENKEQEVFFVKENDKMSVAYKKAQETFKFFWRELYWEQRRIVPAHGLAIVKFPFEQMFEGDEKPTIEYMWVNNIYFDGETVTGVLVNKPIQLTNVAEGDVVSCDLHKISDWMLAISGKTYGGYTIHALRSDMSEEARVQHDSSWGLDFGDYNNILNVYKQQENPENLIEHPMCVNMGDKFLEFFKENPDQVTAVDEEGFTVLHRQAIAGNKRTIEILLSLGADKEAKNNKGKTALEYAKALNWEYAISALE
ncbi:MAG: DUF2314 domain-containing protein [Cellulophaga fucicola]